MQIRIPLVGLISLLNTVALAQWTGNRPNASFPQYAGDRDGLVRGQVSSKVPLPGSLTVELFSGQRRYLSTSLDLGGAFELHGVAPGQYELRLVGAAGMVVYEEPVFITGPYQDLSVNLPSEPKIGKPGETTVSLRQLQHKVPREAQKEFDKGKSASAKKDQANALDHFHKAVSIDPEFADAFSEMGASYVALGKLQQALEQFQKAIDLVPDHPLALTNLSVVLFDLGHYGEAGQVARRALRVNPTFAKMHYVLGFCLAKQGGNKAEALDHLQRAAADIPAARLLAAQILIENDRRDDAVKQLEEYLRSSNADNGERQKVGLWLARLRQ